MAKVTENPRKRTLTFCQELCIVCQKESKLKLMTVGHESLESVNYIQQLRSKLHNDNFEMQQIGCVRYSKWTCPCHFYGTRIVDQTI